MDSWILWIFQKLRILLCFDIQVSMSNFSVAGVSFNWHRCKCSLIIATSYKTRDSWMYPYQRTPMGNPYIYIYIYILYKPSIVFFCGVLINPQESLKNTRKNMGTLLGVHPITWNKRILAVFRSGHKLSNWSFSAIDCFSSIVQTTWLSCGSLVHQYKKEFKFKIYLTVMYLALIRHATP